MTTTKAYDDLVEKLARERDDKLRGNISSVKMSPEETAKEISEIQGGAKSSFEGETMGGFPIDISGEKPVEIPAKKKRGRPKGSRNKSKV